VLEGTLCPAPLAGNHVLVLGLLYTNPDKPGDKSSVKLKQLEVTSVAPLLADG